MSAHSGNDPPLRDQPLDASFRDGVRAFVRMWWGLATYLGRRLPDVRR